MKKLVSLLLLFTFGLSSCEKDDICDANTPTTPRLVLEFFDITNQTKLRPVTNLKVIGDGMTEGIVFNEAAVDSTKYLTNASKVMLPLKVNDTTVTFKLIYNSTSVNANTDVLTINYSRKNEYVSRACGFKTTFVIKSFSPTDPDGDTPWMTLVQLNETNIESENETHIKVYY